MRLNRTISLSALTLAMCSTPLWADQTIGDGNEVIIGAAAVQDMNCQDVTISSGGTLDLSVDGTLQEVTTLTIEGTLIGGDGSPLGSTTGSIIALSHWVNNGNVSAVPANLVLTPTCGGSITVAGTSDTDGDGISDDLEGGTDIDGDTIPDLDVDGDGVYNFVDLDSDNDGKLDADEGTGDSDNDQIPNYLDPNDDQAGADFSVNIVQAPTQTDPTTNDAATFRVTFGTSIDPASFTADDITLAGTTGTITTAPTEVMPNDGTTFEFTVTGMTDGDVVSATMTAGKVNNVANTGSNLEFVGGTSSNTYGPDNGGWLRTSSGNGIVLSPTTALDNYCQWKLGLGATHTTFTTQSTSGGNTTGLAHDVDPSDGSSINVGGAYSQGAATVTCQKTIDNQVTYQAAPPASSLQFSVKALLQAAFDSNEGLMRDNLRTTQHLPLQTPYAKLGYSLSGSTTLNPNLLTNTDGNALVDWVLIELRDQADPTQIQQTISALLQRDGDVVEPSTNSTILTAQLPNNDYYIAIRHLNHLGVMTANPISLSDNTVSTIDFIDPNLATWGDNARLIIAPISFLWAGDSNQDGKVIAVGIDNDINPILGDVLLHPNNGELHANYIAEGYTATDINLDGNTIYAGNNNEINWINANTLSHPNNHTHSANFIIEQQLPE